MSVPIAMLSRDQGALIARDPCYRCQVSVCELGLGFPEQDPDPGFGDFEDDYRMWGPEP